MPKKSKSYIIGFKYKMGLHAIFGVKPIDRIIRVECDNKLLLEGPFGNGPQEVSNESFFDAGEAKDGMSGEMRFYLNGTHDTDDYLADKLGVDASLVPKYQAVSHVVFSSGNGGPFYFGNSPRPREFKMIAERTDATDCPFGEYALLPYDHIAYGIELNDYNPLVIYWYMLIQGLEQYYGDTFAEAAETLFNEGFGISGLFGGGEREALQKELERYVDGRTYLDRQTGLREFMLVRNDFVVNDLPVIGEEHLVGLPELVIPRREIAANTFDVEFSDREKKFEIATFTVQDVAHAQTFGTRRGDTIDLKWITDRQLATEVGFRECRAQASAGLTGRIRVSGLWPELHEGSPFVLDLPSYGISTLVCRILGITEHGVLDHSVEIELTEDVFGVEVDARVIIDTPPAIDPIALPVVGQVAFETPYWLGNIIGGDNFTDNAENPDYGMLVVGGERANGLHMAYNIWVDVDGAGYEETGTGGFTGVTTLAAACGRLDDTIYIYPQTGIVADSLIIVGGSDGEFMRVDAVTDLGATWELTVGRGCIDTAPVAHADGEEVALLVSDGTEGVETDAVEYASGQDLDVKLLTFVNGDVMSLGDATAMEVTMAGRAIRPYPPGRFKVDASYADDQPVLAAELTWAHRDRLLQIDEDVANIEDHDAASIGPEAGTTYRVVIECFDEFLVSLGTAVDIDIGSGTSYTFDPSDALPGTYYLRSSVYSVRDTYESWTAPSIQSIFLGEADLRVTEDEDTRITEEGDFRIAT
jgi:hypothetical protein